MSKKDEQVGDSELKKTGLGPVDPKKDDEFNPTIHASSGIQQPKKHTGHSSIAPTKQDNESWYDWIFKKLG